MDENKVENAETSAATAAEAASEVSERISDSDLLTLERAGSKVEVALANAKQAASEAERAQLAYKNIVLQIFMKYGMSAQDSLTPDGVIQRGGVSK